jgi:uncharacterized protein (DUF4415 family)
MLHDWRLTRYVIPAAPNEYQALTWRNQIKTVGNSMPKVTAPLPAKELRDLKRLHAQARAEARRLVRTITDEEDPDLTAAATADPDNPPLTEKTWRPMRPASLARPELVARQLRHQRSRPKAAVIKEQVTLRIDRDVLEKFRATGPGWQSRINKALRKAAGV